MKPKSSCAVMAVLILVALWFVLSDSVWIIGTPPHENDPMRNWPDRMRAVDGVHNLMAKGFVAVIALIAVLALLPKQSKKPPGDR